jgi:iron(III) transport system substrate-binding protein
MPEHFKAAGLPDDISTVMWDMDFAWSAENRDRVLDQWMAEFEN